LRPGPIKASKAAVFAPKFTQLGYSEFSLAREGDIGCPPTAALEREIVGHGVAEKQKDKARQVFERSADQAGFFEHGRNRLVMPGIAGAPQRDEEKPRDEGNGSGNGGGGDPPAIDPIIAGLLKRLPKSGAEWPKAQRKLWLQLLEGSFDLIYIDKEKAAN
jgi:hypothetical protein